ncbi:MAG: DUF523 domain-containing protein [Clostridia bacterium]|nr:DUF523 domain-containing protein [Clostridia bacterium]
MPERPVVLVSMCLMGVACRYDGRDNACPVAAALAKRCELLPVCPEQLGGLPTPRAPAERQGDRVIDRCGRDVTDAFSRGAAAAVRLAEQAGARFALLKARSPSCGVREIYDGNFDGTLVPGMGMAAEALAARGIALFDETQEEALLTAVAASRIDGTS